ncbi:hypothetical protein ACE6H2_006892 [Prunus campanulata]
MTSETPESTSPITITETEHAVRTSANIPVTTHRSAESMQEFSSELWTLFQERMPATSSTTPPRAEQKSQERERIEPYGEGSSLGLSGHTQASGYGQHSLPPTNSWGQSQPIWANPGPTYPAKTAYGPLQASALSDSWRNSIRLISEFGRKDSSAQCSSSLSSRSVTAAAPSSLVALFDI